MKHTIIKYLVIGVLMTIVFSGNNLFSQENKMDKKPFKDRIFVGGALGFSLGTYSSLVDVSPIFGYSVTDNFIVGIGLTYKYYRYRDYYINLDTGELLDYKTNMFGGSLWTRYFLTDIGIPVIENIFLHAEIEPLVFENNYTYVPYGGEYQDIYGNYYIDEKSRETLTGYFFGGGLSQQLGGRSYLYIEVLWNFNEELYSPYSNPRIRIGIAAGL